MHAEPFARLAAPPSCDSQRRGRGDHPSRSRPGRAHPRHWLMPSPSELLHSLMSRRDLAHLGTSRWKRQPSTSLAPRAACTSWSLRSGSATFARGARSCSAVKTSPRVSPLSNQRVHDLHDCSFPPDAQPRLCGADADTILRYSSTVMMTVATPLLSVCEAAQLMGVSRGTAYRLIERGELPAVRVGGQLRVDRDELREYIYGGESQ